MERFHEGREVGVESAGVSEALGVHLFPVRHHSPRTSSVLLETLSRLDPELVLIEGPSDANALIGAITESDTVPPVAILAYRTDGHPGSTMWPFVSYSPEYVALKWAAERGKSARFIDVSAAHSLARLDDEDEPPSAGVEQTAAAQDADLHPYDAIVARSGYRSFEEFWEAQFEAPKHENPTFGEALRELGETARHRRSDERTSRARDAIMRAAIEDAVRGGVEPDRIVAVLGAAHVAAIVAGDVDATLSTHFEASVPVNLTLIPYSFPRMAEQTGYGAGNRAPYFHQRAHDAGGDYRRAALEVLVDFTDHLRLRGFSVSLADTIEAYRLACRLGDLREKSGPGLDEVREATVATLCRGEAAFVDQFLWSSVVGKGIGRVARSIGRNSLQEEFWSSVAAFKLPKTDELELVSLRLSDATHVEISVFFHRLRVIDVPYAGEGGASTTKKSAAPAGAPGLEVLSRVREAWQCQWTPSTELALVERIVYGETFRAAAERRLEERLAGAKNVRDAAGVLVDAVLTSAMGTVSLALDAVDRLSAHDDEVGSLAAACRALAGLVAYGSSRAEAGADERVLTPLLTKTFARASLRLPFACAGGDDDAPEVVLAMRVLHEVAVTQPAVDKPGWLAALEEVGKSFGALPRCAGTAAGLLLLSGNWDGAALAAALRLRLSASTEPGRTAQFLSGFFEVNALAIVKNPEVVEIIDGYLQSLADDAFRDAVPTLRRAFADLGKTERRYLVESVISARGHAGGAVAKTAARVVTEKDEAQLRAASEDIQKAMDDLDDLL